MTTTPIIHLNGSSAESLLEDNAQAHHAVRKAIEALAAVAPNARDYYPKGDDAYRSARREHEERMLALLSVQNALVEINDSICEQVDERARQRASR